MTALDHATQRGHAEIMYYLTQSPNLWLSQTTMMDSVENALNFDVGMAVPNILQELEKLVDENPEFGEEFRELSLRAENAETMGRKEKNGLVKDLNKFKISILHKNHNGAHEIMAREKEKREEERKVRDQAHAEFEAFKQET